MGPLTYTHIENEWQEAMQLKRMYCVGQLHDDKGTLTHEIRPNAKRLRLHAPKSQIEPPAD